MSKSKRIAKSTHSDGCTYEMDGDKIHHMCEPGCEIAKNGGIAAVIIAMDVEESKKIKRRRHQRRKKRRGW